MSENTEVQANLKFPKQLKDMLKEEAKKNNRSMTSEVVARLQESLRSFEPSAQLKPASLAKSQAQAVRRKVPETLKRMIIDQVDRAIELGHDSTYVDLSKLELGGLPEDDFLKITDECIDWLEEAGYRVDWDGDASCAVWFC